MTILERIVTFVCLGGLLPVLGSLHAQSKASSKPELTQATLIQESTGPVRTNKFTERKSAHQASAGRPVSLKIKSSRPAHHHMLSTDSSSSTSTSEAVSTSTASSFAGSWSPAEWGPCLANCGSGSSFRVVTCVDSAGNELDVSSCDPSVRPSSRQPCQGDCLQCTVNSAFLSGVGASDIQLTPLQLPAIAGGSTCQLTSGYTCCTSAMEEQLLIAQYQMRHSLAAQTQHRDTNKVLLQEVYDNVTLVLNERVEATSDAIDALSATIDAEADKDVSDSITAGQDSATLKQLRDALMDVLQQRTDALETAVSDVAAAFDEFQEQYTLMDSAPGDDDEETTDSGDDAGSSLLAMLQGWLSSDSMSDGADASAYETTAENPISLLAKFTERKTISKTPFVPRDGGHRKVDSSASTKSDALPVASPAVVAGEKSLIRKAVTSLLQVRDSSSATTPAAAAAINYTDPTLRVFSKSCQEAINSYYLSLSCSGCNPSFPLKANGSLPPTAAVPAAACNSVYVACADSLLAAQQNMEDGISALLNSQGNLITQISQVQPLLDRVWSELVFDWLPGFNPLQLAKPDLTRMQCVNDLRLFSPPVVLNSTDFCVTYLSYASPKMFVKRIGAQLDRGLLALGQLASCDRCLHDTLVFLSDVLGESGKGKLDLTIPSKTKAMFSSCAAKTTTTSSTTAATATAATKNGPRVHIGLPSESIRGFSEYSNVTALTANSDTPPNEWTPRSLVATSAVVNGSAEAALTVHVMNLNCTAHAQCFDQDAPSGMQPWWFCAHPNLCLEQPGACTKEGVALFRTGPKCVRGPCTDDMSAIDKQCPVNAICPAETSSLLSSPTPFFGPEYFAKFAWKSQQTITTTATTTVTPTDSTAATTSEVASDVSTSSAYTSGTGVTGSVTMTMNGVCDCAFDSNGAIVDQCMFARCLAYASVLENAVTCNTALTAQCQSIKTQNSECAQDSTLDCSDVFSILTYPPSQSGECPVTQTKLADQTRGAAEAIHTGWMVTVAVVSVIVSIVI